MIDPKIINSIFADEIVRFDHASACAHLAAHIGRYTKTLRLLELGTGYGLQLKHVVPHYEYTTCIDAMYDWVPDIKPDEGFDKAKINDAKLKSWNDATSHFSDRVGLILGNTYNVFRDTPDVVAANGPYDVIIVDGCHHPVDAVEADFWNYLQFMNKNFFVVFDDINEHDPRVASNNVFSKLKEDGYDVKTRESAVGHINAVFAYCKK